MDITYHIYWQSSSQDASHYVFVLSRGKRMDGSIQLLHFLLQQQR